jgi:regulator of replication initiation timing/biotin operon repressor
MFNWLFGKSNKRIEEETKKGFESVKKDMELVGKWVKHLDFKDKQLFDNLNEFKQELSSIRDELGGLREALAEVAGAKENKQLFEKMPVLRKQTPVSAVQEAVQTPVQTASFYDILKGLTSNERLLIFTLMNSDLKLSYEDLALLLGKERATIRGQINSIKQKSEGLILEISEKNGKKRVYIPEEIKEKLAKYAKVRVGKKNKSSG